MTLDYYNEQPEYVPHNINNSVCKLGDDRIKDIHRIEAALDDDEVTQFKVASGTAIDVENPSSTGTVVIEILEASESNEIFWAAREAATKKKFSFTDSAAPKLDTNGRCRIRKPVNIVREGEPAVVAWTLGFTYLKIRGGSYTIEQSE